MHVIVGRPGNLADDLLYDTVQMHPHICTMRAARKTSLMLMARTGRQTALCHSPFIGIVLQAGGVTVSQQAWRKRSQHADNKLVKRV